MSTIVPNMCTAEMAVCCDLREPLQTMTARRDTIKGLSECTTKQCRIEWMSRYLESIGFWMGEIEIKNKTLGK